MNIKTLTPGPIAPLEPKKKVESKARAQASTERDADGRRDPGGEEPRRHLTQQEFDEALKVLEELPGLKSHNLTIKVEVKEDCRVILVIDPQGQIIRRLSESQLWAATRDKDRHTGRILDKAM
ncbi:MAG: hypothetical protein AB7G93_17655 [Bdellovibrionales bacterium]